MTAALDANKDGEVSLEEFTAMSKKRFEALDANKDGKIDEAERKQATERMAQRIKRAREKRAGPRDRPDHEPSEESKAKPSG